MRPLLMVMNPRTIPQCMEAINALDISKVFLKNWSERQLVDVIADVVESADFDTIGLLSDDTIPPQSSLDLVLDAFEPSAVYTGYCNMDELDGNVNLSSAPLVIQDQAGADCYTFPTRDEAENHDGLYRSWFTGFAMTFMSKEMWLRFPFDCVGDPGYQSDYRLSVRLQQADVPVWAVPGAFMEHLRRGESTRHLPGGEVVIGNGSVVWDV
jgi:GT2 family glycosyltransferase